MKAHKIPTVILSFLILLIISCEKEEPLPNSVDPINPSDTTQTGSTDTVPLNGPLIIEMIPNALTDFDGNVYDAVRIGDQVWMASNLRTTHLNDSVIIPMGSVPGGSRTEPYRYAPNNNEANVSAFGYLYNWPAMMNGGNSSASNPSMVQGICPKGWHVPSMAEWTQLVEYCANHNELSCNGDPLHIAKALSSNHDWRQSPNTCAVGNNAVTNNFTGFNAVPAGRYNGSDFTWTDTHWTHPTMGDLAQFWSASATSENAAHWTGMSFQDPNMSGYAFPPFNGYSTYKSYAFSVRCVRD